eukprot:COSAG02_NODE_341_length_24173_cov_28.504777_29_plen_63_part_00
MAGASAREAIAGVRGAPGATRAPVPLARIMSRARVVPLGTTVYTARAGRVSISFLNQAARRS